MKIRGNTGKQKNLRVFYYKSESKCLKLLPKSTIIEELPKICLKDEYQKGLNYLIYINNKLVDDTKKSLSAYSNSIEVKFILDSPINCSFLTASNPRGNSITFDNNNFYKLLDIDPSYDIFKIFDSKGIVDEEINDKNYKTILKKDQEYYFIKYPRFLEEMQISIKTSAEKKEFFTKILTHLDISRSELQQLLCIFYKLEHQQELKGKILNSIQKYDFIPLRFYTKKLIKSDPSSFLSSKYFLSFLVSLPAIKIDSRSYIEVFEELSQEIDLKPPNSPFKIVNLRELFFNQNVEKDSIIQIDSETYGLYRGESTNDPEKSTYFDPFEDNEIDFDFADHFLAECRSNNRTRFEDIFFDTREFKLTSQILGDGAFGTVFLAYNINDGKEYAAKVINTNNEFDGSDQMKLMRESMILKKLHHPSIVQFFGFNFQSFQKQTLLAPTIITEYLKNGSLRNFLPKSGSNDDDDDNAFKKLDPTKKYIMLLGISNAMKYLHQHGIIHRDLKPENILIDENLYPQICDFDLSRCFPDALTKSMQISRSCQFGTPIYLAPEMIDDDDGGHYGPGVDVYAFSIIAYEIISDQIAYIELRNAKKTFFRLLEKIRKGERPKFNDNFTEKMKDLISKCWSSEYLKRPSFSEIFNALSNDLTYSKEKVDKTEIENYIKKISQIPDPPNLYILDRILIEAHDIEKIFFNTNEFKITSQKICEGAFSKTYCAKKCNDKKHMNYSASIINTDIFKGYDQMILIRESLILSKLNHPSIIKFYGLNFQSFYDNQKIKPKIINEFLKNGTMKNILKRSFFINFDNTMKCICLLGISHAMNYVHQNNIIHGFLSLENILLDENNYPRIRFPHSFSNIIELKNNSHKNFKYQSPELLNIDEDDCQFGKEIDVYSFAIVAFEILTGEEAFHEFKNKFNSTSFKIKVTSGSRPSFPFNFNSEISNLISNCWSEIPSERPSFDVIFRDLLENYAYLDDIDEDRVNYFVEKVLNESID